MSGQAHLVLVIDDEELIVSVLTELLQRNGYRVISARDGKQGLHLAQETRPDIILCDVMMPEVDGLAVRRQLSSGAVLRDRAASRTLHGGCRYGLHSDACRDATRESINKSN